MLEALSSYFNPAAPDIQTKIPDRKKTVAYAQPERVGLLFTDELENATKRCYKKVEAIIKDCRARNCRFRDIEFDLEEDRLRCLYGLALPEYGSVPADVRRVTEIFENPQFFIDGANSSDVAQGNLGDCWFMSAIAVVSTVGDLISRICVHRDEEVGVYGFIFYRDSEWVDVIIDDLLYTKIPKYEALSPDQQEIYHNDKDIYEARARTGSKTLYFAKSKTENETWVPLIEKAYAKLHGDYASLSGGFEAEGIEDLTGGIATAFNVNDIMNTDRFWKEQLCNANKDRLFSCAIMGLEGPVKGIITAHAYSVTDVLEVNGKRFVRLRNPWGESEWQGAWSDGSKEWTKEWLERLPELKHQFGDDGEFLMEYKDFLKTWTLIERSRLFDSSWRMSSLWVNVKSRNFPCAWDFGDVSFTFSVTEDGPAVIVLSQLDDRYFPEISGYAMWSLDFVVYRKGAPAEEPYTRASHNVYWRRSVNVELDNLEAGEYVVHVRLDREHQRPKTYFQDSIENWNVRKLSKVWAQACISKSIAANFDKATYGDLVLATHDTYGGEDLGTMEAKRLEAEKAKAGLPLGPIAASPAMIPANLDPLEAKSAASESGMSVVDDDPNRERNGITSVGALVSIKLKQQTQGGDSKGEGAVDTESVVNAAVGEDNKPNPSPKPTFPLPKPSLPVPRPDETDRNGTFGPPPILSSWPDDVRGICERITSDEANAVTIGLRIYTKGSSVATIAGQLRQGKVVERKKKDNA